MVSAKSIYAPNETRIDNAPAFSDESLALQFADLHADDLRYVAAWGKWLHWEGSHWEFEDTALAFDLARQICRESALACNERDTMRVALASARTVAAVERLAKSDRRLAATIDQWDSDPFALATPDGVVDLRTGGTKASSPD